MGRFDGKVALVTGGSRGIGKATSLALAAEGASVAVNYVNNDSAAGETISEIKALGVGALAVKADVSDEEQVAEVFGECERDLAPVDILVANAGITRDGLAVRMSPADFDAVIATNLRGPFLCTRAALRHMMKSRWGRVVYISSIAGLIGNAGQANYSAAKAGLIGLAKSMSREMAGRGITFNVVAPGFIETEMTAGLDDGLREQIRGQVPVGRFGEAAEVADAVTFLCRDESSYVCGAVLPVDGGMAM